MTLDLIEQVTALRGQVRAIESEWDAVRSMIQKGWQRIEKANERAEKRDTMEDEPPNNVAPEFKRAPEEYLTGFARKLQEMRGG